MRRLILMAAVTVVLACGLVWLLGGFDVLAVWAADGQRAVQNAMATTLRHLKTGEPGALALLLGLAFGYGFFHAAGPGHGKMLIGAYGLGSRVRLGPLVTISVVTAMAQATVAVMLVYAGIFLLNWTRERIVAVAESVLDPVGYAAIAAVGLWLAWRGVRGLRKLWQEAAPHHHDHDHHHDHVHDAHCGHSHGPGVEELSEVRGLRDAALLIAGVAMRPCTGAIFLLILSWRMGIDAAGIAGVYAMGLGTASVTVVVAVLAVLSRDGAVDLGARIGATRVVLPVLELAAGAMVAIAALLLLGRAL